MISEKYVKINDYIPVRVYGDYFVNGPIDTVKISVERIGIILRSPTPPRCIFAINPETDESVLLTLENYTLPDSVLFKKEEVIEDVEVEVVPEAKVELIAPIVDEIDPDAIVDVIDDETPVEEAVVSPRPPQAKKNNKNKSVSKSTDSE